MNILSLYLIGIVFKWIWEDICGKNYHEMYVISILYIIYPMLSASYSVVFHKCHHVKISCLFNYVKNVLFID